ncbi:LITAF-like zinc ribbon domain-containing protein [Phlyctochytrium arcticum]|nr:LITAF-like zinc ribbon domain-containing protein [Phlyctochytrium arcticum]
MTKKDFPNGDGFNTDKNAPKDAPPSYSYAQPLAPQVGASSTHPQLYPVSIPPTNLPNNQYPGSAGSISPYPPNETTPLFPAPDLNTPSAEYYTANPGAAVIVVRNGMPIGVDVRDGVVFVDTREPLRMHCPYCNQTVITKVRRESNGMTYCSSLLLCFVFWPCFFLPFCMDGCKDRVHSCPNCKHVLAVVPA